MGNVESGVDKKKESDDAVDRHEQQAPDAMPQEQFDKGGSKEGNVESDIVDHDQKEQSDDAADDNEQVAVAFATQEPFEEEDSKKAASSSSKQEPTDDDDDTPPEEYAWMSEGIKIFVKEGKHEMLYPATIQEKPTLIQYEHAGSCWMVRIKYDGYSNNDWAECSQCQPVIDLSTEEKEQADKKKRSSRRMKTATDFYGAADDSPSKRSKKSPPTDLSEGEKKRSSPRIKTATDFYGVATSELTKKPPPVAAAAAAVTPDVTREKKTGAQKKMKPGPSAEFERARLALCQKPGMTEREVLKALRKVGPPYGLQTVMHEIEQARKVESDWIEPTPMGKFKPDIGMQVRKYAEGYEYLGEITGGPVKCRVEEGEPMELTWEVTFEGGIVDDMTWDELFQCRIDRPKNPAPCRGRQLYCLEMFAGHAIVSQEFREKKWKVASIDNSPSSNATITKDILAFDPARDLGFVPDFIWASPPCETYSRLSGDYHRTKEDFDLSAKSREHNFFFQKMCEIMYWAKAKAPHVVVVIENPVGRLQHMPLMKQLTSRFGLYCTTVHYCAFGRHDKKPTMIWTNDFGLQATLSEFTCEKKCPYYGSSHPLGVRSHGNKFNAAAIPQPLAEEVAHYVDSKFYFDRIRYTPAASSSNE